MGRVLWSDDTGSSGEFDVDEFRRGWPVLTSAMIGNGLGFVALPFYTLGALAPQLAAQFGWSYAQIMTAYPVVSIVALGASPFIGRLTDRIGVRPVALTSLALFSLAFMLFALNPGSLSIYYGNWVLLGLAGSGTLPIIWTRAVNNWFDVHKGLALGITMMGTGIFGSLAKLTVAAVLTRWSWTACYLILGLAPLLIALPIALLAFRDRVPPATSDGAAAATVEGLEFSAILRSRRFWTIGSAFLLVSFALSGAMPHLENILADKGFARSAAATIVVAFGLAVVVGRVAGGFLLDRIWAPLVGLGLFLAAAAGIALFLASAATTAMAYLLVVLVGLGTGAEYDLMSFMVARYFGMRRYGSAYGTLYLMFGIGAGAGPVVFGRVYDLQGSYATMLEVTIGLLVLPCVLMLTLGRYTYPLLKRSHA